MRWQQPQLLVQKQQHPITVLAQSRCFSTVTQSEDDNDNESDRTSFGASWRNTKDRLLAMEVGSWWQLQNQHGEQQHHQDPWIQAGEFLKVIRRYPNLLETKKHINNFNYDPRNSSQEEPVQLVFQMWDRFLVEAAVARNSKQEEASLPSPPLGTDVLLTMLAIWRDHLAALTPSETASEREKRAKHRRDNYNSSKNNNQTTMPSFSVPSTEQVLELVKESEALGLFRDGATTPAAYGLILRTMMMVDAPHEAPYKADQMLADLLQRTQGDLRHAHHPNSHMMYHVIDLWASSWLPEAAQRAEHYLQTLKGWYRRTQNDDALHNDNDDEDETVVPPIAHRYKPHPYTLCAVMEAHSRVSEPRVAMTRIQELLDEMVQMGDFNAYETNSHDKEHAEDDHIDDITLNHELDHVAYTRACNSFAVTEHPEAPSRARAILDQLCKSYLEATTRTKGEETKVIKPTQHTFSSTITAYARAERADQAQQVFDSMERMAEETGDPSFRPNVVCYTSLIWAYARVGDSRMAEAVFGRLLKTMLSAENDSDENDSPGSKESKSKMESSSSAAATGGGVLSVQTVEGVLAASALAGDPHSIDFIQSAISHLHQMIEDRNNSSRAQQNKTNKFTIRGQVTVSTYNKLLKAHSQQGTEAGAQAAEQLFEWLKQQQAKPELLPNRDSTLEVIWAWCNAANPERANAALLQFVRQIQQKSMNEGLLDPQHFNLVIEAWSRSKHPQAAEKAQAVFDLMEEINLLPNGYCYTSLMWAWARASPQEIRDPAKRVEELFEEMQRIDTGDDFCKPEEVAYSALLFALSRSPDPKALARAETHFRDGTKRHGVARTREMYNTLMSAWAKRRRPDRMEALFQEMKTASKQMQRGSAVPSATNLAPHFKAHTTRLQAWARVGNPEMTVAALNEWVVEGQDAGVAAKELPCTRDFCTVLQAWLRSRRPETAERVEQGLAQMYQLAEQGQFDCLPDAFAATTVLSAIGRFGSDETATVKVCQVFDRYQRVAAEHRSNPKMQPNALMYTEAICAVLLRPSPPNDPEFGLKTSNKLLGDMERKPASFWDGMIVNKLADRIGHAIRNGSATEQWKETLLNRLDRATTSAMRINSNKNY